MSGGKNCYPESDVLINKYNIREKELLENSRSKSAKLRIAEKV